MKDKNQQTLFELGEWWQDEWQDMPEFIQKDLTPFKSIYVHFENREALDAFARLVNQTLTSETKSIWYPKVTIERYIDKQYIDKKDKTDGS